MLAVFRGPIFFATVWSPLRHTPVRALLAMLAIALGVALGSSIYLVNRVAAEEVAAAARQLYGLADFAVEAPAPGLDEQLYPQIARLPGVAVASPVVMVDAKLADRRGALTVLGVDVFRSRALQPSFVSALQTSGATRGQEENGTGREQPGVLLSASAARELQLHAGDTLKLQSGLTPKEFIVKAVLAPGALRERAAVMDIGLAQWKFDRLGKLSRIDLRVKAGTAARQVRDSIQSLLPTNVRIVVPGEASDDAVRLSRAYRANLTALALVALFTGGFFVFSTQALGALRRRREFAVFHALGLTRTQQLQAQLLSAAMLGTVGSVIGLLLGIALARLGIGLLGGTIGLGYFQDVDAVLAVRSSEVAVFCALGVAVALAGALRPAFDAAQVPTAAALKAADVTSDRVHTRWLVVVVSYGLGIAALQIPAIKGLPLAGYAGIALLLIATVLSMPGFVHSVLRHAPRFPRVTYELALAQMQGTARYAALSVAAVVVSFSLMVAMAVMVQSFRQSLNDWTEKLLPADVYVRAGYVAQSSSLDPQTVTRLTHLPGLARTEISRFAEAQVGGSREPIVLMAVSNDRGTIEQSRWIVASFTGPKPKLTPVWISEVAAERLARRPGDLLSFELMGHAVRAYVAGIWRDYEYPNGALIMELQPYRELTQDDQANTVWFWLARNANESNLREAIAKVMPMNINYDLRVPRELRRMSLEAFDRTFAITYLLESVAITIGLFGIATGVGSQIIARRAELGALRHIGMRRRDIARLLALEGAMLGFIGVVIGLTMGLVIGWILIFVVNRQSFHWSMDVHVPVVTLAVLSLVLIATSALIAAASGRRAMSADSVRSVGEDW
jgi:putative ABC transport system permease protein